MSPPTRALSTPPKWNGADRVAVALLVGLVLVLYASSIGHPPVYDDDSILQTHVVVTGHKPLAAAWHTDYWGFMPVHVHSYRPIAVLLLAAEHALGGFPAHRVGQLVWQCLAAVLGYLLCRRFTQTLSAGLAVGLFAAGASWSEAVFSVAARPDLMTSAAWAGGLLLLLSPRPVVQWLTVPLLLLAGLSKETAFVLPLTWGVALLAVERLPGLHRRLALLGVQVAGVFGIFAVRAEVLGSSLATATVLRNPLLAGSPLDRTWGALELLARLQIPGFLNPFARSIDCSAATCAPESPAWSVVGLAFLIALGAIVWKWRHVPALALSLPSAFILYLPISNLLLAAPTAYAERAWHPVALALTPILAVGIESLFGVSRMAALVLALPLLAVEAGATLQRGHDWQSYTTLVEHDLAQMPDNAFLALELAALRMTTGQYADARALAHLGRPKYDSMRSCDIEAMASEKMGQREAALAVFAACQHLPAYTDAVLNYATLLAQEARYAEALAVIDHHIASLRQPAKLLELRRNVQAAMTGAR